MATARSTTPRKPAAHFSVAQAEKDFEKGLDEVEPFTVELSDGDVITFADPRLLGWQVAASIGVEGSPFGALREVLSDEDYKKAVAQDFPQDVFGQMFSAYRAHYGVDRGN